MTERNWADKLFDVFCLAGSIVVLTGMAATLYLWPKYDRFW